MNKPSNDVVKEQAKSYNWIMLIAGIFAALLISFSTQLPITISELSSANKETLSTLDILKIVAALAGGVGNYIMGFFTNQKK